MWGAVAKRGRRSSASSSAAPQQKGPAAPPLGGDPSPSSKRRTIVPASQRPERWATTGSTRRAGLSPRRSLSRLAGSERFSTAPPGGVLVVQRALVDPVLDGVDVRLIQVIAVG